MRTAPVIETERLRLRPYQPSDLDPIAAMLADERVMRHVGGRLHDREESWRRILGSTGLWTLLGYGYWVVERRDDGRFLGQAGFGDFRRAMLPLIEGLPEAGWMFAGDAQGQGYATESMMAALHWADAALGSDQIVAIIDPENAASIRVAEKCGFALHEPATYRDEPILLFRRPAPRPS